MKILVGFECSGIVAQAFSDLGHSVTSCDIKPGKAMALQWSDLK